MQPLNLRILADRSEGVRVHRYDPITGDRYLFNPETNRPESWPFAGVQIEGEAPDQCRVPTSTIARGVEGGWMELENQRVTHAPGGPESDPWRVTHTFVEADAVILKCVDGDYRYVVIHNPGKYDDPSEPSGTRVDWFMDLERA